MYEKSGGRWIKLSVDYVQQIFGDIIGKENQMAAYLKELKNVAKELTVKEDGNYNEIEEITVPQEGIDNAIEP